MTSADFVDGVEVLWRPGCPFCSGLRRGLRRRGIETVETDIWQDRTAAERIRAVTGGDEIVPTVFIGPVALVNPSVREVESAIEQHLPGRGGELVGHRPKTLWSRLSDTFRNRPLESPSRRSKES
ncbi:glutaredoxin domain-containing protein [Rhodococcus rhodochrous]|uniref:Glutaredoxin n=1 Tax=Rhodococcus rhodochrous KG-21 TaxID=1441923 RepID=A0A0M9WN91_RHORH|nr:glutaredoxin domain-containing protein [Rhodococcus rhodochrous]KOS55350.1 glutaredoxin [Rhodococcus rhodochrous KG-21]